MLNAAIKIHTLGNSAKNLRHFDFAPSAPKQSVDDAVKFFGVQADQVRVCPKSYNALACATADAATLRACTALVGNAQRVTA